MIFRFASPLLEQGKPQSLIKEVTCVPGDALQVDTRNRFFYCNGQYLGMAKVITLKGALLPMFVYSGRIPGGRLFVSGRHRDSFDSRYWGFLDARNVRAIATPIF